MAEAEWELPKNAPLVQNTSSRVTQPAVAPTNILLSGQQDWSRVEQLNSLVGDLIVLDNKFLSKNNHYSEILEIFSGSFSRLKGSIMALKRWETHASASHLIAHPSASII